MYILISRLFYLFNTFRASIKSSVRGFLLWVAPSLLEFLEIKHWVWLSDWGNNPPKFFIDAPENLLLPSCPQNIFSAHKYILVVPQNIYVPWIILSMPTNIIQVPKYFGHCLQTFLGCPQTFLLPIIFFVAPWKILVVPQNFILVPIKIILPPEFICGARISLSVTILGMPGCRDWVNDLWQHNRHYNRHRNRSLKHHTALNRSV